MTRVFGTLCLAALAAAAPALADPGGRIDTLDRGEYTCERPGDATTSRGVPAPDQNFKVVNASAYVSNGKRGKYLRLGDQVTMTSGPLKPNRYEMKNGRYLRQLGPDGQPNGLRCVRER
ncbi:MAG: hypothetical protein J7496_10970 [Novosphingobium sp.]|nr:hypothetical protein [Novosphingobium sp.]MBO9603014.1 hypothetical protein [Novosphingobium sp.]